MMIRFKPFQSFMKRTGGPDDSFWVVPTRSKMIVLECLFG
jgi:hypothetical protein